MGGSTHTHRLITGDAEVIGMVEDKVDHIHWAEEVSISLLIGVKLKALCRLVKIEADTDLSESVMQLVEEDDVLSCEEGEVI